MVKANVSLTENTNDILNFVKATKGFKFKGEVIDYIVSEYAEKILDREEFQEEFIQSVLANRQSAPSEWIDITSEAKQREFLGL